MRCNFSLVVLNKFFNLVEQVLTFSAVFSEYSLTFAEQYF